MIHYGMDKNAMKKNVFFYISISLELYKSNFLNYVLSLNREAVGSSVTLQGNLDPCQLYANKVGIIYVISFIEGYISLWTTS